jgi:hypothetical protein
MKMAPVTFLGLEIGDVSSHDLTAWVFGKIHNWLVVWNIFIVPYIGNNHPN